MVVKKVECEGYGGLGSNGSRKTEVVVQYGVYQETHCIKCMHFSSVLQTQKACNAPCLNAAGIEFDFCRGRLKKKSGLFFSICHRFPCDKHDGKDFR